jgi:hypothetical protein
VHSLYFRLMSAMGPHCSIRCSGRSSCELTETKRSEFEWELPSMNFFRKKPIASRTDAAIVMTFWGGMAQSAQRPAAKDSTFSDVSERSQRNWSLRATVGVLIESCSRRGGG